MASRRSDEYIDTQWPGEKASSVLIITLGTIRVLFLLSALVLNCATKLKDRRLEECLLPSSVREISNTTSTCCHLQQLQMMNNRGETLEQIQ